MPSLAGLGFDPVTAVQETKVDVFLWYIARIPHTSGKSCWVDHGAQRKSALQESPPIIKTSLRRPTPICDVITNYNI